MQPQRSRMHQEPDKAKELNNEQGNGGYNSLAIANTSPANAESSSGESPPVDRKDFPDNRNNSLISGDQGPDKPEELNNEQDNAGHNSPAIANASPANVESSRGESPPVDRKDISSNGNNYPISGVADHETDKPEESNNEQDNADHSSPAIANASPANVESSSAESPPVEIKDMSSNSNNSPISGVVDHETDKPEESINEQDHADHNSPAIANASPANVESSSVESPPVDIKDMSSNGNNSPISGVADQGPDRPEESNNDQDNADHNSPATANASPANVESSSGKSSPVDRKDRSSNGNNSPISGVADQEPDKPEKLNDEQDNVDHSSAAVRNASPANVEFSSEESPPVDRKDISSNGNNSPISGDQGTDKPEELKNEQDNAGHNSNVDSSSVESPPVDRKNISSNGDDSLIGRAKSILPYAAVGVAAGTAAVVAAPAILSAAGFTAGGVAAGSIAASIQSVFYGGSVASGSAFALVQSAGTAGIGAAGNAAIGGITAGISGGLAALGNYMFNSHTAVRLLICGCETEASAFAGIASSLKNTEVRVLCLHQDEAERWNAAMKELNATFHRNGEEPASITSQPALVTSNPEDAIRDVNIVVFMLPASAHQVVLDALKPHIKPGTIIVGLPGGPGFEFQVLHMLGDVGQQCTIMNFESSPWVCNYTEYGVDCEVLGNLVGAIKQGKDVTPKKDAVSTLQSLLGRLELPKMIIAGNLLGVQLMSVNAYLNTSIVYCQWEGWDGIPLDQPPLFYNGLTESAANLLSSVSDEVVNIAKDIELKTGADMSGVVHIHLWLVRRYFHDISDKSTLYKAIQTNAAFQGIKHPVKTTEDGKFMPDFTHRYMTEDVPYGLVVIRGIAEIVGVQTPNIDKVLTWCQEKMGKEYLVNSKLQGKDVASSRAPQRYGFTSPESILLVARP